MRRPHCSWWPHCCWPHCCWPHKPAALLLLAPLLAVVVALAWLAALLLAAMAAVVVALAWLSAVLVAAMEQVHTRRCPQKRPQTLPAAPTASGAS